MFAVSVVGYPKWAHQRRGEVTRRDAREALGIEPSSRPMVVWLPTWADHSSLDRYWQVFSSVTNRYDVVMKPHHNSQRFEQARLDAIVGSPQRPIVQVPTTTSLVSLLTAADVAVSDVRSGGLTEGLLADRPVVALADGSITPDALHPAAEGAVELCTTPEALEAHIATALDDPHAVARGALVTDLFGPATGDDDDRAASAILQVARAVGRPARRRVGAPAWRGVVRAGRRFGR